MLIHSFRGCLSLRDALNTRSTCRLITLITPIRAHNGGPPCSATSNSASIAACRSSASCSAMGSLVMYVATSRSVTSDFRPGAAIGSTNHLS